MDKPVVAAKAPAVLELPAGTHYWCACGRSQSQPFCDGSHRGTGITPLPLVLTEPKKVALCQCKATGKAPYCDGTHRGL